MHGTTNIKDYYVSNYTSFCDVTPYSPVITVASGLAPQKGARTYLSLPTRLSKQDYYVSNCTGFCDVTPYSPVITVASGLAPQKGATPQIKIKEKMCRHDVIYPAIKILGLTFK